MKILLAAPQADDTVMGVIGRYCERALRGLGHRVECFDFRRSRYLRSGFGSLLKRGIKKIFPNPSRQLPLVASMEEERMNAALARLLEEVRPDVLFALLGDGITTGTLEKARKAGAATVNWFPDPVLAPTRKSFVEEVSPYYDYFFMFDSPRVREHIRIGSKCVMTVPLACSPETHRRLELSGAEKKEYGSDVAFIGTVKFKRGEILASLKDFDLGVWGAWTRRLPELENRYRRKNVFGEEAVKIYNASTIVLDVNEAYNSGEEISNVTPRVFEAAASGTLLMTNETPLITELFEPGKELVCYRDEKDLKEKIVYFLAHPAEREAIAEAGRRRALRDHTYKKRMELILSVAGKKVS